MPPDITPKKHSKLAIGTLVINMVYFALPLLTIGLYVIAVELYRVNLGNASELAQAFNGAFVLFAIGTLIGVAVLILDIKYLATVKPVGKSKVFTIISLVLCCIASITAVLFTVLGIGLSAAMS